MSLPGLVAQPLSQIGLLVSPIDQLFALVNTNPYFIGVMMLVLNLGGRFLVMEVSKEQELFFQNVWVRRFLIFIVLFVATRSIQTAALLTVIAVLVVGYLLNENSALCILNGGVAGSKCAKGGVREGMKIGSGSSGGGLTPEESEILRRLSEKQARYAKPASSREKEADAQAEEIYLANMALLRGEWADRRFGF